MSESFHSVKAKLMGSLSKSRLCGHFHLHDSQDLSVLVVRGGYITRHALLEKVENYYDLRLQCQDIDFVVVFQITVLSE